MQQSKKILHKRNRARARAYLAAKHKPDAAVKGKAHCRSIKLKPHAGGQKARLSGAAERMLAQVPVRIEKAEKARLTTALVLLREGLVTLTVTVDDGTGIELVPFSWQEFRAAPEHVCAAVRQGVATTVCKVED